MPSSLAVPIGLASANPLLLPSWWSIYFAMNENHEWSMSDGTYIWFNEENGQKLPALNAVHSLKSMNMRQRMIYETFDGTVQVHLLLLHSTSTSTVVTLANKKSFTILIKFAALKFMGQKLTSIVSSAQQRHKQPFLDPQRARSWKTTKIATFTLSWEFPSIRNEDAPWRFFKGTGGWGAGMEES